MAGMETVLERLRAATVAEQRALAAAIEFDLEKAASDLGVDPGDDTRAAALLLAKAYKETAKTDEYRDALVSVAKEVARKAEWDEPKVDDEIASDWIEDYIYAALIYTNLPDHDEFDDKTKATFQKKAIAALNGDAPSAKEETNAWAEVLGAGVAVGLGVALGWWLVAPVSVLAFVGWLLSPSLKKLVPATLLLVHIRKRQEFEAVLREEAVAA